MNTKQDFRQSFTHRFKHGGREYTLFKREKTKDAPYYIHFAFQARRYKQSLQTNVQEIAITRAKRYIDAVRSEKWETVKQFSARSSSGTRSTIGRVFDLYPKIAMIGERTAKNNILSMRIVISEGTGQPLDPSQFTLDGLTADLLDRYQKAVIERYLRAARKDENSQREARDRACRTSRSYVRQARSLFNRRMSLLNEYAKHSIELPDSIYGFMSKKLIGKHTKKEYLAPPDSVVQAAFIEIENLRDQDPNSYLAFWFAVGAGLRRKEIQHLQWEHVIERDGATWVSGGLGKDGEQIEVPMQKRAVDAIASARFGEVKCHARRFGENDHGRFQRKETCRQPGPVAGGLVPSSTADGRFVQSPDWANPHPRRRWGLRLDLGIRRDRARAGRAWPVRSRSRRAPAGRPVRPGLVHGSFPGDRKTFDGRGA